MPRCYDPAPIDGAVLGFFQIVMKRVNLGVVECEGPAHIQLGMKINTTYAELTGRDGTTKACHVPVDEVFSLSKTSYWAGMLPGIIYVLNPRPWEVELSTLRFTYVGSYIFHHSRSSNPARVRGECMGLSRSSGRANRRNPSKTMPLTLLMRGLGWSCSVTRYVACNPTCAGRDLGKETNNNIAEVARTPT